MSNPFPSGFQEPWQRGSVLGGSTAVNGMMYVRGQQADFDALEQRGNPGWGWEQFLSAPTRRWRTTRSARSPVRGEGGPLGVTVQPGTDDETVKLLLAAAAKAGWPFAEDVNAEDSQHIGFTPSTIKNGVRQSTANTFLWPIRRRKNLTIVTDTTVDRLEFDGQRVVGVTARQRDRQVEYTARKDVILSAGALETPQILERSGIGRADVLARAGVDLRVESPNVGERIIEQHGAAIQVRFKREIGDTLQLSSKAKQLAQGARYVLTRKGPVATGGLRPDGAHQVAARDRAPRHPGRRDPVRARHVERLGRRQVPGHVPARLPDPAEDAELAAHHVHRPGRGARAARQLPARIAEDRQVTGTIVDHLRNVIAQEPLASEVEAEEFPGPEVQTPEEVVKFAHSPGVSIYHAVGSAAMGPEDDDVVAPDLRVRGVDGLRVADISILPDQPSGNTAAPPWPSAGSRQTSSGRRPEHVSAPPRSGAARTGTT